jgi:outer membrane murein-binding lipoprotein Lpp
MKFALTAAALTALLLAAAGCSSITGSISPAKYDKMNCPELNGAVGDTATDISRTAIARGRVANTPVPTWLLGGERVKTVVANRETARIDRLQQQQQVIVATRRQRCPASQ